VRAIARQRANALTNQDRSHIGHPAHFAKPRPNPPPEPSCRDPSPEPSADQRGAGGRGRERPGGQSLGPAQKASPTVTLPALSA
jgi:hypothetical protein